MIMTNEILNPHSIIATKTYTTGSTATIKGHLQLADDDDLIDRIMAKLNFVPTFEHKCNSCGGVLEIRADEHIFRCPFCNSCYAIGTNMKNDRG